MSLNKAAKLVMHSTKASVFNTDNLRSPHACAFCNAQWFQEVTFAEDTSVGEEFFHCCVKLHKQNQNFHVELYRYSWARWKWWFDPRVTWTIFFDLYYTRGDTWSLWSLLSLKSINAWKHDTNNVATGIFKALTNN